MNQAPMGAVDGKEMVFRYETVPDGISFWLPLGKEEVKVNSLEPYCFC